jgi:hypothetical protein
MDPRVIELHCIMPIGNVASVMSRGILSHERAAKLAHASVAAQVVQDRRSSKQVPRGLKLHQYANLYFNARNPMMYLRRAQAQQLCVLRLSTEVFQVPGAVITDCNAASDYVRFLAPSQFQVLEFDEIFAERWTHPDDPIRAMRHKSRMCAETLIPGRVAPRFIRGAYVLNVRAAKEMAAVGFQQPIDAKPAIFFA